MTLKLKDGEREKNTITVQDTYKHFNRLNDLIKNKYYDNDIIFQFSFCRTKPYFIAEILIDGEYRRFRYF